MARLFKKRKEKKQAEEAARKQSIQDLKLKNQAKRAEKAKSLQEAAKVKKSKSPGSAPTAPSRVTVDGKIYTSQKAADMAKFKETEKQKQVATKRGSSNIQARKSAKPGETYQRTEATGEVSVKRKSDPSKKNQPKPVMQESSSKVNSDKKEFGEYSRTQYGKKGKQTYRSKPGESEEDFKKRVAPDMKKNRAKHGGALAIMIAPVKNKNKKTVKAIKKGDKAENGGRVKDLLKSKSKKREEARRTRILIDKKDKGRLSRFKAEESRSGGTSGKVKKMENGGKVKKRTTTVAENTPSVYSKFTDAQKSEIKARRKKLTGEDKKDFDYDLARTKDTKSKTTTTTKRRSGKVKSQSVTEKRKSSIPGRSTDVTTTSEKRRGGSTRVKTTSYGAGDDRDAGRVVKQKFSRKGGLKKTKVLKAMYGAKMKKMENGGKVKKDLEKQKKDLLSKQNIMRYGDKESGFSERSIEKMGAVAYSNRKKYNKPQTGVLNKKAISKLKVTPKVKKTNKR